MEAVELVILVTPAKVETPAISKPPASTSNPPAVIVTSAGKVLVVPPVKIPDILILLVLISLVTAIPVKLAPEPEKLVAVITPVTLIPLPSIVVALPTCIVAAVATPVKLRFLPLTSSYTISSRTYKSPPTYKSPSQVVTPLNVAVEPTDNWDPTVKLPLALVTSPKLNALYAQDALH